MKRRITILQLLSVLCSFVLLFSCAKEQKPEPKPKPEEEQVIGCKVEYFDYFFTSIIDPHEIVVEYVQPRYDYEKIAEEFTEDIALLRVRINPKKGIFYSYDSRDKENKAMFYKYADSLGDGIWDGKFLGPYLQETLLEPISSVDATALTDFDEDYRAGSSLNDLIEFRFVSSEKYFIEYVIKKEKYFDGYPKLEVIRKPIEEIKDLRYLSIRESNLVAYLGLKKPATLKGKKLKVSIHFPTKTLEATASLRE